MSPVPVNVAQDQVTSEIWTCDGFLSVMLDVMAPKGCGIIKSLLAKRASDAVWLDVNIFDVSLDTKMVGIVLIAY